MIDQALVIVKLWLGAERAIPAVLHIDLSNQLHVKWVVSVRWIHYCKSGINETNITANKGEHLVKSHDVQRSFEDLRVLAEYQLVDATSFPPIFGKEVGLQNRVPEFKLVGIDFVHGSKLTYDWA